MKKIMIVLALLLPQLAFAENCTINTNSLHFNDTNGTNRIESILRSKGYDVVTGKEDLSEYSLEVRYSGNGVQKTLYMMVWNTYPKNIFNESVDYKTPFGVEGGVFERIHAVELAKQIPACRSD